MTQKYNLQIGAQMSKIRIKHGDNEIELEGSDDFIEMHLESFYGKVRLKETGITAPKLKEEIEKSLKKRTGKAPTPAEFYKNKGKTDGVSKILIFAKYLELYKDQTEFSRSDINNLVKEARLSKEIHSQYYTNSVKQGLLRALSGSKYTLTLSAEEVIASM